MTENKQRITMMTRKEKAAGSSEGWGADTIRREVYEKWGGPLPYGLIQERLQNEPCELSIAPIKSMLQNRVAFCRIEPETLEPKEVAQQAAGTIAVIDELIARLEFLHPDIEAEIDAIAIADRHDFQSMRAKTEGHLQILREALDDAHGQLSARPSKTGPKRTQWMRARDDVAACIQENSNPPMTARPAKSLATDLLELCGLPSKRKNQ